LIVWNELAGCRRDVPLLPRDFFDDVFAVDGGSTDGTVEYLESQSIPVFRQPERGLNAAYHHAVAQSKSEAIVIFFPKGTLDPRCVIELARPIADGVSLVIASRNLGGAVNEEDRHFLRPRKWGVNVLSLFASVVWRREGARITDVLHGVKAFRKDAFLQMNISHSGLTIDLEMVVRAYRLRLTRLEVPVREGARIGGQTHFKILPTAKRLARFLMAELVYPPKLVRLW